MVYFVIDNGTLHTFLSEKEMKAAGYKKPAATSTDEEYNSNGCYARIIGGAVKIGKTDAEKAEEIRQGKIAEYKSKLAELDRQAGAGRFVRDTSLAYARANGMDSGKGYESMVEIETLAAPIREELAPLLAQTAAE